VNDPATFSLASDGRPGRLLRPVVGTLAMLAGSALTLLSMSSPVSAAPRLLTWIDAGAEISASAPGEPRLTEPFGVAFGPGGTPYVVEMVTGNRVLEVRSPGKLIRLAGRQEPGDLGDGGPALDAQFRGPHGIVALANGDLLIADTWNGRIRRIDTASGRISSLPGYAVAAELARTAGPYSISLDPAGQRVVVADLRRVQVISLATGICEVVAGNGEKGVPVDGARAKDAPLVDPRAAAYDRQGNLYILERKGHALRVVDPEGRIRTVVNRAGKQGAGGDDGDAREAMLNGPKHLCIDRDDSVIIADAENDLIRRYVPATGRIHRVAGTGRRGAAGVGGSPLACELNRPHGVTLHPDGSLIIVDSYNHRLLQLVP